MEALYLYTELKLIEDLLINMLFKWVGNWWCVGVTNCGASQYTTTQTSGVFGELDAREITTCNRTQTSGVFDFVGELNVSEITPCNRTQTSGVFTRSISTQTSGVFD